MELALKSYQEEGVSFALQSKRCYFMLDMGVGKTAMAIEWCKRLPKPASALVIAPLMTALTSWPEEIEKWSTCSYSILYKKGRQLLWKARSDFYITNYESLPWLYTALADRSRSAKLPFNVLIIDEGSAVKSWKTKRFKIIKSILPFFPIYRLILSGTPAPNSILDLWSQYYILDEGDSLCTGITKYKNLYFKPTGYRGYKFKPIKGAKDEIYKRISPITFRVSNDLLDMPAIQYNDIHCTMPKKAKKIYDTLLTDLCIELEKNKNVVAEFSGSLIMKLRQITQGALYLQEGGYEIIHKRKAEKLKEFVRLGYRVLVPIQFKFDLDIIQTVFKKEIPFIGGVTNAKTKITTKDKLEYIHQWNDGKLDLLLCHPLSLGHGVNLQKGGNIIVWYALPWSLEQYLQLNARLHRMGQKNKVIVHHLIMKGTVDDKVLKALTNKKSVQDTLLNYFKQITGIG